MPETRRDRAQNADLAPVQADGECRACGKRRVLHGNELDFPGMQPGDELLNRPLEPQNRLLLGERLAAAYLTDADVTDRAVRLDVLSMLVLSESRGLIRHTVNVLSAWSGDVGL